MSRQAILDSLRLHAPGQLHELPPAPELSRQQRIECFIDNITTARAEVIRCNENNAAGSLQRVLQQKAVQRLCVGAVKALERYVADLPHGIQMTRFDRPFEQLRSELFAATDAGLTTCEAAIADTGTLVIYSHSEQPRLLSLVPPIHIALLHSSQLQASMADWLATVDPSSVPTNMVLISGPSKSADIEQVLAYGVHGPRQLIVLLVE